MVKIDLSKAAPPPLDFYPWDIMLQQGHHWMDRHGTGYWIEDMSTDYLERALPYAVAGARQIGNAWWRFAMVLNGDIASDTAERVAMQYDEGDVPLVNALRCELAKRKGEWNEHAEYNYNKEYSASESYMVERGYEVMGVFIAIGEPMRRV